MIRSSLRKGFTLIELLLVVIIIGIVASIALPRFASVKGAAYTAVLNSDLKTFNTTQELQFNKDSKYATTTAGAAATECRTGACNIWTATEVAFSPSQDVQVQSLAGATNAGNAIGYYGKATHAKLPSTGSKSRCVSIGETTAASASTAGADLSKGNGVQYDCN